MITSLVFFYSAWCSPIAMGVLVTTQLVMSLMIPPDFVVVMNRSPEWAQSVPSIISMLTPDVFGTAMFGTMTFALCLAVFGSMDGVKRYD